MVLAGGATRMPAVRRTVAALILSWSNMQNPEALTLLQVVLAGGATRMPAVRRTVAALIPS